MICVCYLTGKVCVLVYVHTFISPTQDKTALLLANWSSTYKKLFSGKFIFASQHWKKKGSTCKLISCIPFLSQLNVRRKQDILMHTTILVHLTDEGHVCQKTFSISTTASWVHHASPYKNSRELLFSHENLMRFSWENDFLMRIFEIWWEFFMRFFAHENFIFLMRSFFFSWELKKLTRLFLDLVRFYIQLVGSSKRAHEGFYKLFYWHHTFSLFPLFPT